VLDGLMNDEKKSHEDWALIWALFEQDKKKPPKRIGGFRKRDLKDETTNFQTSLCILSSKKLSFKWIV
jgi:hypothetical protein